MNKEIFHLIWFWKSEKFKKGEVIYYINNFRGFILKFGKFAYVDINITLHSQKTFDEFINWITTLNENKWIQDKYNIIFNNHIKFVTKALNILQSKFIHRNITRGRNFSSYERKIDLVPNEIKDILFNLEE